MENEVRAAAVDLRGVARLLGGEMVDGFNAAPSSTLRHANRFEEGQLAGPLGPQFVGYGDAPPPLPWWLRLRPALLGLGCGAVALAADAMLGKL